MTVTAVDERLLEIMARQSARVRQFGVGQPTEHLDGKGYRAQQEKIAWPDHEDDRDWQREEDFGTIPGQKFHYAAAEDMLLALSVAGYSVVPTSELEAARKEIAGLREGLTLQQRVKPWMAATFGPEISMDRLERNDRFIEEALELVQASDYPKERALALVDYVYGRDQGEINQEVGGVMITLAAHCLAHGVDMHEAGETELARIWTKVEQIRAKQLAKPHGSALPVARNLLAGGNSND